MKLLCISLGCDKNLVDAERMLGSLSQDGYTFTDDEQEADVILVNTCCFINDAKEESVNTILEMAEYKKSGTCKALLVSGCMAQRYKEEILQEGDIINVDVSTIYNGYFSDSSRMFCIGEVSPEKKRLVEVTKQAIEEGLKQVRPWGHLGDMGQAINDYATANGYTVVREIGGHGVGLEFHEDPWVSFVSKKGTEMLMVPGMIFTIEPMINMGKADIFVDAENDWTIYTDDGMPSAQWEIQVLVTEDGYEIISY